MFNRYRSASRARWSAVCTAAIGLTLFLAGPVGAQDGTPDGSFYTVGMNTMSAPPLGSWARIDGLAIQPADGRIVMVGEWVEPFSSYALVMRLNLDGTIDTNFGSNGYVTIPHPIGNRRYLTSVTVLPNGRILAAGESGGLFMVVRLLTTGGYDHSFGSGGIATAAGVGPGRSIAEAVLVTPSGYLVAGVSALEDFNDSHFGARRFTTAGPVDPTYNGGAPVAIPITNGPDWASGAVLTDDGGMILGGTSFTSLESGVAAFARLQEDGSLHPDFLDAGYGNVDLDSTTPEVVTSISPGPNGTVYVGGWLGDDPSNATGMAARIMPDGSLDSTFAVDGVARIFTLAMVEAIEGQADGKVILAGRSTNRLVLIRLLPNGEYDPTFGTAGIGLLTIPWSGYTAFAPSDMMLGPSGRIVVAGTTAYQGDFCCWAAARFRNALPVDDEPGPSPTTALAMSVRPNPVYGSATVDIRLPEAATARLVTHDVLGREVSVVHDATLPPGNHAVAFDSSLLRPGVYVLRLGAGGESVSRTITVVR